MSIDFFKPVFRKRDTGFFCRFLYRQHKNHLRQGAISGILNIPIFYGKGDLT